MGIVWRRVIFSSSLWTRRPRRVREDDALRCQHAGQRVDLGVLVASEETEAVLLLALNLRQCFFVRHTLSCSIE